MNRKLFKSVIAAAAVAMICACGDDASSDNATDPSSLVDPDTSVVDNPYSSGGVTDPSNPGNTQDPGNTQNPTSSAGTNPDNPQNPNDPTSSADGTNPTDPTSSAGTNPVTSSSSVNTDPELDENGFPTIESYGPPPAEYTKDISASAPRGWNTRYWDACKPHCSWLRESENDKTRADITSNETYLPYHYLGQCIKVLVRL